MKKIFFSFFVFGLMFFAGELNNVQARVDVFNKTEIEAAVESEVNIFNQVDAEIFTETIEGSVVEKKEEKKVAPTLSDWVNVGNPGFSSGVVNSPVIAIDSNNISYVAYADYENNNKATVMKFNGLNWEAVGISGFSMGPVSYTSIAFDSNNNPYVAFSDFSSVNGKATVMKFNGTTWESVGSPGFSSDTAYETSLVIGSNNVPYVVFEDYAYDTKVTVMKFNGTSWINVGSPGFSLGQAQNVKIALDGNNVPYVAYMDSVNNNKATVMKFDGINWISVGTSGFSTGPAYWISLAINSNNIPFVVYKDVAYGGFGTAMKFNGTNWVNVGIQGGIGESGDNSYFSLAFNSSDIPYIAYRDGEGTGLYNGRVTVCKFDGTYWVNVGNPEFSEGNAYQISLVVNTNDIPHVAFQDEANDYKVTVMKYLPAPVVSSLTITSPNGGEIFMAGNQFTATWTSTGISANDDLYFGLVQDGTNLWYSLTGYTLNDGSEVFTIPSDIHAGQYKMYGRKLSTNIDDFSDSNFTVNILVTGDCTPTMNPWIKVLKPNGGEIFHQGNQMTVEWSSCNVPANTLLEVNISSNGPLVFGFLAPNGTPNDGIETFFIDPSWPNDFSYKIIVGVPIGGLNNSALSPFDRSDFPFTITSEIPSLAITSPNGGETFVAGDQFTATWTSTGFQPSNQMYFGLIQNGTNLWYSLTGQTLNDGTEVFIIPQNIQPGQYRMYGRFIGTTVEDHSNNSFTIN